MSHLPAEADRHEPLAEVVEKMREQHCHHIPVMDGAHLYGILSREDLHELAVGEQASAEKPVAGDVCKRDLLTVDPMMPIVEVAKAMIDRKVGSALVTDGGVLVGIFTNTDALRLIAEL
ncbi:MAG: CBS domain-containing protein [bacterium]|nr:CBS domain-containing protein [bacterium]